MMRQRSAARLDKWLVKAKTSHLPDFANLAEGIERDPSRPIAGSEATLEATDSQGISSVWARRSPAGEAKLGDPRSRFDFGR